VSHVPVALARVVRERANDRCEYCGLAQEGQEAEFHIDHIVPRADGGPTEIDNLALACVSCSLRKAAKRTAPDHESGSLAPLFHPRQNKWSDHFSYDGVLLLGRTAIGRATIAALEMNRDRALQVRQVEERLGRYPPPPSE